LRANRATVVAVREEKPQTVAMRASSKREEKQPE
jgi:hypothetical protein